MMSRRLIRLLIVVAVLAVLLLAAAAWFGPIKSGESRDSPDGRYKASAMNVHRGTLYGRRWYVELEVVDNVSHETVWIRQVPYSAADDAPELLDRSERFVEWSSDSSSVTLAKGTRFSTVVSLP